MTDLSTRPSTLRPGLMVALRTGVRGGIKYDRVDLIEDEATPDGGSLSRWQTTKVVIDKAEYERASRARERARSKIEGVCSRTSFGLLCPTDLEADLRVAYRAAQDLASEFNREASTCRVEVNLLIGRIAQSDREAVAAISAEMRSLLGDMEAGVRAADPKAIRDAATKAKALGAMLTEETQAAVSEAVEQARKAAATIVRRVEKASEDAATVVAELQLEKLTSARFAFLDADDAVPVGVAPVAARAVALDHDEDELPPQGVTQVGGDDLRRRELDEDWSQDQPLVLNLDSKVLEAAAAEAAAQARSDWAQLADAGLVDDPTPPPDREPAVVATLQGAPDRSFRPEETTSVPILPESVGRPLADRVEPLPEGGLPFKKRAPRRTSQPADGDA